LKGARRRFGRELQGTRAKTKRGGNEIQRQIKGDARILIFYPFRGEAKRKPI